MKAVFEKEIHVHTKMENENWKKKLMKDELSICDEQFWSFCFHSGIYFSSTIQIGKRVNI